MSYNNLRHSCRKVGLLMNKRGEETRKHIKKCACSLFSEKGFKQVTMKDICDVSKLSRGGLYCHYEST
ncbi:TetR/AcrR family transcriptional regulator, partial [uncultured Clostridium sp.]|uniref:TetR/AcrR family transcriptional regulator n=1 Tax=uncultured Clostridium sp. TaxID=59620 RepID=UPI00344B1638